MKLHYYLSLIIYTCILLIGKFTLAQTEFETDGIWYRTISDTSATVIHPPLSTLHKQQPNNSTDHKP
mgnify:CR=1 FL=1